jgi:hypothetical protein
LLGLNIDDSVWDVTVFTKNRKRRLLGADVAQSFFAEIVTQASSRGLLSTEYFTVDGTLIETWASHKSFKRKDRGEERPDDPGNPTIDSHGEQHSNASHQSTTDPEARLARKGPAKEAKLNYAGHVLMENRNGIAVNGEVTPAEGHGSAAPIVRSNTAGL